MLSLVAWCIFLLKLAMRRWVPGCTYWTILSYSLRFILGSIGWCTQTVLLIYLNFFGVCLIVFWTIVLLGNLNLFHILIKNASTTFHPFSFSYRKSMTTVFFILQTLSGMEKLQIHTICHATVFLSSKH